MLLLNHGWVLSAAERLFIERSSDFSLFFFNVVNYADWILSSELALPSPRGLDTRAFFCIAGLDVL